MAAGASGWCFVHDPSRGRERAQARKKGGRNRRAPKVKGRPDEIRLRSVEAVQKLLERTVADTLAQENSAQRSRTLGYLAGLALKALEVGELEERLTALEMSMTVKGASGKWG